MSTNYSLLLAARRALNDDSFARVLHACSIISFRYNVIGNNSFADKREAYRGSKFVITRKQAEKNSEWNTDRIGAWQNGMAKLAASIWRIDQLS